MQSARLMKVISLGHAGRWITTSALRALGGAEFGRVRPTSIGRRLPRGEDLMRRVTSKRANVATRTSFAAPGCVGKKLTIVRIAAAMPVQILLPCHQATPNKQCRRE